MAIKHIGLVCASEEISDRFYVSLLGLKKTGPKILPAALARKIFNLDSDYPMINYANDDMHFEIFIDNLNRADRPRIEHTCIEVEDLENFLQKCRQMHAPFKQIPKGDALLTFVADFDGNLFEIKEKPEGKRESD